MSWGNVERYNTDEYQKRWNKSVTVFDQEQYDGDWPDGLLADAISWFQRKLNKVPAEFRSFATIEFDSSSGYEGSHYAHIFIKYSRPETDDEWRNRLDGYKNELAAKVEEERAAYLKLQAKYGTQPEHSAAQPTP